ncbi:MAG: glycosyltransferase family 2 protein [Acidobacteriota bacterium]
MVSVIIATKDRAEALGMVSLPSLARQESSDFEIIIWDASCDDASQRAVEDFAAAHPDVKVKYYKAPRVGLPSQRNDALAFARDEIVFFIDDDSEVSPDGIGALAEAFANDTDLVGAALPLRHEGAVPATVPSPLGRLFSFIEHLYLGLFLLRPWGSNPKVLVTACSSLQTDRPGPAFQFVGCDMAFRRAVLETHHFLEEMQRFSNYAYLEDMQFSYGLYQEGKKLRILDKGYVIHRPRSEARLSKESVRCSMSMFNRYLIWKTTIWPYRKVSIVPYLWSLIGEVGLNFLRFAHRPIRRIGYWVEGARALFAIAMDSLHSGAGSRERDVGTKDKTNKPGDSVGPGAGERLPPTQAD